MNWLESKLNEYNTTRYRLSKETGVSEQYLKKIIDNDISLMDLKHWQALAMLDFFDKINEVIKQFKPDVVHAQHIWTLAGIAAECCKRSNIPITYKEKTWHSAAQFCSDMNIPYRRFYQRIKRGMSVEKAVELQ